MLILLLNSRQILVSVMPFGKIIEVRLHVGLSATTPNSAPSVNSQLTAQMWSWIIPSAKLITFHLSIWYFTCFYIWYCKILLQLFTDSPGPLNNFVWTAKFIPALLNRLTLMPHLERQLFLFGWTSSTCKSGDFSLSTRRSESSQWLQCKKQVLKLKGHQASQLLQGCWEGQELFCSQVWHPVPQHLLNN